MANLATYLDAIVGIMTAASAMYLLSLAVGVSHRPGAAARYCESWLAIIASVHQETDVQLVSRCVGSRLRQTNPHDRFDRLHVTVPGSRRTTSRYAIDGLWVRARLVPFHRDELLGLDRVGT